MLKMKTETLEKALENSTVLFHNIHAHDDFMADNDFYKSHTYQVFFDDKYFYWVSFDHIANNGIYDCGLKTLARIELGEKEKKTLNETLADVEKRGGVDEWLEYNDFTFSLTEYLFRHLCSGTMHTFDII